MVRGVGHDEPLARRLHRDLPLRARRPRLGRPRRHREGALPDHLVRARPAARERRLLRPAGGEARRCSRSRAFSPTPATGGARSSSGTTRRSASAGPETGAAADELPPESQVVLHRGGPAVIQAIDVTGLVALAEREGAVIAMAWAVGDTLVDGIAARARPRRGASHCRGPAATARPARVGAHVRAGPQVRAAHPRGHRDQGALAGHQRPHDRRAGPRPGGGPPAPPRPGEPRGRARARRAGEPPPRLPGPEVGGLPGPRLRRDPVLRCELDPGHAADAGPPPGPEGPRPARATRGPAALPGAGRQRHPPDLRGRATTGRTPSRWTARGSACRGSGGKPERGSQGAGDPRPRRPDRLRAGPLGPGFAARRLGARRLLRLLPGVPRSTCRSA